jgi:hypothetical protein
MNNAYRLLHRIVWLAGVVLLLCGCHRPTHPCTTEPSAGPQLVTTPSVDAARAAQAEQTTLRRPHGAKEVRAKDGAVTHTPLYFADPFEEVDAARKVVAWSGADYLYLFYGPGRFLANTALFPISAITEPPWQRVVSDVTPDRTSVGHGAHSAGTAGVTD